MLYRSLILLLTCHFAVADTVTIGIDEWYPITGNPSHSSPGLMLEIANQVFDDINYKVLPWKRALEEVRSHRIDCILAAGGSDLVGLVTPEAHWIRTHSTVFIRHDDPWTYRGAASLLNRYIGIVGGYGYGGDLSRLIKDKPQIFSPLSGAAALERNIKKLISGRIDTLIDDEIVTAYKLRQLGLAGKIKAVGFTNPPDPIYLACSPKRDEQKQLIKTANKALVKLRSNGSIEKIMVKYQLAD